jgi:hypothetical protein
MRLCYAGHPVSSLQAALVTVAVVAVSAVVIVATAGLAIPAVMAVDLADAGCFTAPASDVAIDLAADTITGACVGASSNAAVSCAGDELTCSATTEKVLVSAGIGALGGGLSNGLACSSVLPHAAKLGQGAVTAAAKYFARKLQLVQ